MKVSADGLLKRCASEMQECGGSQGPGYAFMLKELLRHMHELSDRYRAGDTAVVGEFIALYGLEKAAASLAAEEGA